MSFLLELLFSLFTLQIVSGGTVESVSRSLHRPDRLFLAACPVHCEQLFRAKKNTSICGCDCPVELPVFLHTTSQCIEKLDECQTNIRFSQGNKTAYIPVAVLPAKNGVLLSKWHLVWQEAGLSERSGHVNCSVDAVFFENFEHRWKALSRKLFALMPVGSKSSIIYRGSEGESTMLTGSVVQLKLSCYRRDSICVSFRVDGTSGRVPEELVKVKWELVLACLCCVLLLALVATFYIGYMCWRMEKRRLIGRIQMQILCDYRRQQEAQLGTVELGESGYKPVMLPKRRLLFHTEFLAREFLESPSEEAELFLLQLRRMVDMARERIRQRRFIPMLITIPEMPEEEDMSPPSPQSMKSVDSGRDSRSEGSDDSSSIHRPSKLPLPKSSPVMPVIVPPRPPLPSKIPTSIGSVSPRTTQKSFSVAQNKSYKERKGYAVFPVDPMLNKSLPRRKRNSIPPLIAPKPLL